MKSSVVKFFGIGAVVALSAACGGSGDDDGPTPDSSGPPPGDTTQYVMNSLILPGNAGGPTADDLSFDLDGADTPNDNALGSVIALLGNFNFDLQPSVTASINAGSVVILNELTAEAFAGTARWQVFLGNETAAPPAFDGNDTLTKDPSGPSNAILDGEITGGSFHGGPGSVSLSLALVDGQPPLNIDLVGAQLSAGVSASGATDGILGGAITDDDVRNEIIPAIANVMTGYMLADCTCTDPGPPSCTGETTGETLNDMFNTTADCSITPEELLANTLVQTAIMPDVDMFDASGAAGHDGDPDSLSLGVGFTAVGATF